ncbi:hypothetical protein [Dactylosporangium sp. NPDC051541]|uniref:hypothetical protein n=1 Tax=Dactylosporangium sp. NPDC051541 TaxID=3363977 RepID=UPI0037BE0C4A
MDGHWEWTEGGDDADTADLGGDAGHDLHGGFDGDDFGAGFDDGHTGFGGDEHDLGGHLDNGHPGDDLEEPLGTEHATAEYDESLHGHADLGGHTDHPGASGNDGGGNDGDGDQDAQNHDGTGSHDGTGGDGDSDRGAQIHDDHLGGDQQTGEHADQHDAGDADQQHGGDLGQHSAEDLGQHEDSGEQHEAGFGTDPDVDASADDPGWHEVQFPEELHLQDPPAPVDGFPWTDADVLGGPDHSLSAAFDPAVAGTGAAEPAGLADYEHLEVPAGSDAWSLLLGSDDPATSSLATYWAPQ